MSVHLGTDDVEMPETESVRRLWEAPVSAALDADVHEQLTEAIGFDLLEECDEVEACRG